MTSEGRERVLLYSQVIFERRMDFLEDAPLEPRRTRRLRALARLQLLRQSATGLPWREVALRLAKLVRTDPRIVLRPALWRLVVAQLGGRRVRSALRRPSTRRGQPAQGEWARGRAQGRIGRRISRRSRGRDDVLRKGCSDARRSRSKR